MNNIFRRYRSLTIIFWPDIYQSTLFPSINQLSTLRLLYLAWYGSGDSPLALYCYLYFMLLFYYFVYLSLRQSPSWAYKYKYTAAITTTRHIYIRSNVCAKTSWTSFVPGAPGQCAELWLHVCLCVCVYFWLFVSTFLYTILEYALATAPPPDSYHAHDAKEIDRFLRKIANNTKVSPLIIMYQMPLKTPLIHTTTNICYTIYLYAVRRDSD